jgi:hypothetical protein
MGPHFFQKISWVVHRWYDGDTSFLSGFPSIASTNNSMLPFWVYPEVPVGLRTVSVKFQPSCFLVSLLHYIFLDADNICISRPFFRWWACWTGMQQTAPMYVKICFMRVFPTHNHQWVLMIAVSKCLPTIVKYIILHRCGTQIRELKGTRKDFIPCSP